MVAIQAIYKSHRTTIDGAFSITFEMGEDMADCVNEVYKLRGEPLYVVVMSEEEHSKQVRDHAATLR